MPVNRRLHSLGMVVASAAIVAQPIVLTTAAQAAAKPDCSLAMQSPSPDSISLLVLLEAHAFDREHDIPDWYQAEFADAVRASLVMPRPLAIDSYESDKKRQPNTAHQSLRVVLRAILTADGRIREARVVGGARNEAFDRALLAALAAVDRSGTLRQSSPMALPAAEIPIILQVTTTEADAQPHGVAEVDHMPLFSFRAPLRVISRGLAQVPGVGHLQYPIALRRNGTEGDVVLSYVVGADGKAEQQSPVAIRTSHVDFLRAVLASLPDSRYRPLELNGCAVRAIVETPFTFRLDGRIEIVRY